MLTLTGWLVRAAAVTLPRDSRARYAEQWSADVRDADHAGVRRFQIVFGAFRVAAGIWPSRCISRLSGTKFSISSAEAGVPLREASVSSARS